MSLPVLVGVLVQHLPRSHVEGLADPAVARRYEAVLRRLVDEHGWSVPQLALRLAALRLAPDEAATGMLAHLESGGVGEPSERELAASRGVARNHRRADLRAEAELPSGPPASPESTRRHLAEVRALLDARRQLPSERVQRARLGEPRPGQPLHGG